MSAYISYSDVDNGPFTMLLDGLQSQGVKVWDRASMGAGESRRDQLRKAISECDVCVFLATQNSIKSDWCKAEVGAFWGAGKGVIVFMVGTDVEASMLPPQLQEDIRHDNFRYVIRDVKKIIFDAEEGRKHEANRRPKLVNEMTIALLYDALASLRSSAQDALPVGEAMRLIHESLSQNLADEETIRPLIGRLVGVPQNVVEQFVGKGKYWPILFRLTTDTGEWVGFAKEFTSRELTSGELTSQYSGCLLILYDAKPWCAAAVTANAVVGREERIVCEGLIENGAGAALGMPKRLEGAGDA
jgi:hypothetical protein